MGTLVLEGRVSPVPCQSADIFLKSREGTGESFKMDDGREPKGYGRIE